jgi:hypothetical protein
MVKVDFFCIGAQKAGTTLLHDILKQHPNICLPSDKEAHFFDVNELYELGLEYYTSLFENLSTDNVVGNINPNLQIDNRSMERIIETFGNNIKIIFLLRNPVTRAYSHYLMSKKRGFENLTFENALEHEQNRINNPIVHKGYYTQEMGHFERNHFAYIQRGLYSSTLKFLYQNFSEQNIKIIFFEEFIQNMEEVAKQVLDFLKVDNNVMLDFSLKSNPGQKPKSFRLSRFLHTSSPTKRFLKNIIPKNVRVQVKNYISEKNYTTLSIDDKKLSIESYNFAKKYFEKDIQTTGKILNNNMNLWN